MGLDAQAWRVGMLQAHSPRTHTWARLPGCPYGSTVGSQGWFWGNALIDLTDPGLARRTRLGTHNGASGLRDESPEAAVARWTHAIFFPISGRLVGWRAVSPTKQPTHCDVPRPTISKDTWKHSHMTSAHMDGLCPPMAAWQCDGLHATSTLATADLSTPTISPFGRQMCEFCPVLKEM